MSTTSTHFEDFAALFNRVAYDAHTVSREKGFWEQRDQATGEEGADDGYIPRTGLSIEAATRMADMEMLALVHTEISEAAEAIRTGDPPDKHLQRFKSSEVELADAILRIMDMAIGRRLQVGRAIVAKLEYNTRRPHKHGKLS